jgi:hypothetical protein
MDEQPGGKLDHPGIVIGLFQVNTMDNPTVIPGIEDADIKPISKIENSRIKQKNIYYYYFL